MITPTQVVEATMSKDAKAAIEAIEAHLKDEIAAGPGETMFDQMIRVVLPNHLNQDDEYAVDHILNNAGWCNVKISGNFVYFYFPHPPRIQY